MTKVRSKWTKTLVYPDNEILSSIQTKQATKPEKDMEVKQTYKVEETIGEGY